MRLTHLSLSNFRNFSRLDKDLPGGPILLVGGNAQGKTSLLEAVYYLAALESFHATQERQLINFLAWNEPIPVARIVADFEREDAPGKSVNPLAGPGFHRLEIRLYREGEDVNGGARLRKDILFDETKRKAHEVLGAFNAVLFLPQMTRVIEGSPEDRRRYLNLSLSQALPQYAPAISEYSRVMTQRNALLKQFAEKRTSASQVDQELSFWDEKLAAAGAAIIQARLQFVQELERMAARIYRDLTRGEVLRLVYQPSYDPTPLPEGQKMLRLDAPLKGNRISLDTIRQGFQECLLRLHSEEIFRGVTTVGPHRDELRFVSDGHDLGLFGSRGQVRTAILALKLAEIEWIKDKTGQRPVLLLDEVLAELDANRRADLLDRLVQSEQTLMTTTDLEQFSPEFIKQARVWHVQHEQITEQG